MKKKITAWAEQSYSCSCQGKNHWVVKIHGTKDSMAVMDYLTKSEAEYIAKCINEGEKGK